MELLCLRPFTGEVRAELPAGLFQEASDPETTPSRLEELNEYAELRPLIAKNPNAPLALLLPLWRFFPGMALENPLFDLLLLEDPDKLVREHWFIFQKILAQPEVPESLFSLAWGAGSYAGALARHPRLPREIALEIARHEHPYTRAAIAMNHDLPYFAELEVLLIEDTNAEVLLALAKNPRLSPEYVERLAVSEHFEVRRAIVARLTIDAEVFARFSVDPHPKVVEALADKPELTNEQLATLGEHEALSVRGRVLCRLELNDQSFARLSADVFPCIVRALAKNPQLTASQLEILSEHVDSEVRENVAMHQKTPVRVLERLSKEKIRDILLAVRENPGAPMEIRERLRDVPSLECWRGDFLQPQRIGDSGRLLSLPEKAQ